MKWYIFFSFCLATTFYLFSCDEEKEKRYNKPMPPLKRMELTSEQQKIRSEKSKLYQNCVNAFESSYETSWETIPPLAQMMIQLLLEIPHELRPPFFVKIDQHARGWMLGIKSSDAATREERVYGNLLRKVLCEYLEDDVTRFHFANVMNRLGLCSSVET